jgi:hypothetical protein
VLDKPKALYKKADQCNWNETEIVHLKGNNIKFIYNTAAFEIVQRSLRQVLKNLEFAITEIEETDQEGSGTKTTLKAHNKRQNGLPGKTYFVININIYKTTSTLMVNGGKSYTRFEAEVHPILERRIEECTNLPQINSKIERVCIDQAEAMEEMKDSEQRFVDCENCDDLQQADDNIYDMRHWQISVADHQDRISQTLGSTNAHSLNSPSPPPRHRATGEQRLRITSTPHNCERLDEWGTELHIDNPDEICHCNACKKNERDRHDTNNTSIYGTPETIPNQRSGSPITLHSDVLLAGPLNPQKRRPAQANRKATAAPSASPDQRISPNHHSVGHASDIPDKYTILRERERDLAEREIDHRQRERKMKATEKKLVGRENELANNPRQLVTAQSLIYKLEAEILELRESARIGTQHSPPNTGHAQCNSGPSHHHNSPLPTVSQLQLQQVSTQLQQLSMHMTSMELGINSKIISMERKLDQITENQGHRSNGLPHELHQIQLHQLELRNLHQRLLNTVPQIQNRPPQQNTRVYTYYSSSH